MVSLPHHCMMSGDSVKLSWVEGGKVRRQHWAEDAADSRSKSLSKKTEVFLPGLRFIGLVLNYFFFLHFLSAAVHFVNCLIYRNCMHRESYGNGDPFPWPALCSQLFSPVCAWWQGTGTRSGAGSAKPCSAGTSSPFLNMWHFQPSQPCSFSFSKPFPQLRLLRPCIPMQLSLSHTYTFSTWSLRSGSLSIAVAAKGRVLAVTQGAVLQVPDDFSIPEVAVVACSRWPGPHWEVVPWNKHCHEIGTCSNIFMVTWLSGCSQWAPSLSRMSGQCALSLFCHKMWLQSVSVMLYGFCCAFPGV